MVGVMEKNIFQGFSRLAIEAEVTVKPRISHRTVKPHKTFAATQKIG